MPPKFKRGEKKRPQGERGGEGRKKSPNQSIAGTKEKQFERSKRERTNFVYVLKVLSVRKKERSSAGRETATGRSP